MFIPVQLLMEVTPPDLSGAIGDMGDGLLATVTANIGPILAVVGSLLAIGVIITVAVKLFKKAGKTVG